MQLNHKVALVTGAAAGLGRALVLELADRGCHVAICDVDDEGLRETAAFANGRGVHVSEWPTDVSQLSQVQAFVEQSLRRHGHVDLLINAAGRTPTVTTEPASCDELRAAMDVNMWGVIHTCTALVAHLRTRPQAHIVNASTLPGMFCSPTDVACVTTRHAVLGFSQALRAELAESRVLVSVPRPWSVPGPLSRRAASLARGSAVAAARRIVRAVERDEQDIVVGFDAPVRKLAARVVHAGLWRRRSVEA